MDRKCPYLRQLPKTVEGVQVWGLAITCQRVAVQLDPLDGVQAGLSQILVVPARKKGNNLQSLLAYTHYGL